MKTDKNSRTHSTTSGTPSHPELTVPDTNQKKHYAVHFNLAQQYAGRLIIEATSLEEVRQLAGQIEMDAVDWQPYEDTLTIDEIAQVEGGESHE
jgi:hypothetical protein